jgi:proton-translocating NADH-quinone oxidoreductase chain L
MLDDPRGYLWLIPFCPLLGSVIIACCGRWLREQSHWPCILGAGIACVLSFCTLIAVGRGFPGEGATAFTQYYTWFQAGHVAVTFSLRADGLTAVMLVTVTFVGSFIAIYSAGYMHGDKGYARYFAEVSLFLFAMTGLVLANNFILLYAFWEGVGLCSYLLIGFWFTKPSAAAAARKAFLVTRLGDIGLLLGILLLWITSGSLDFQDVLGRARQLPQEPLLTVACVLLFIGAAGKSAQFPLHVWLPDAMEGPSPVSALIHAATMVTAGVYLVARCMPLFGMAPDAQLVVACIGGFTALLAALIALTQTDLKRVLAYSTISQLGYMFLALGSGVQEHRLAAFAVTAAIFHLFTHAFFKALLFLSAGSVMHAMGDVIDMRRFGGLRKVLPVTHWTFLCGAAALAGFPLLSGFWSKDEILAVTWDASRGGPYAAIYFFLLVSALVTAGLTAFYTFRAYFMTFWGETRLPEEAGHHPHDAPPVMAWPLRILAVGALLVGIVLGPTHLFGGFLEHHWTAQQFSAQLSPEAATSHLNIPLMLLSALIALAGIGLAYVMYVQKPSLADVARRSLRAGYDWSRNKFYLDELFEALFVRPVERLARLSRILDQHLVDALVDLVGQTPAFLGYLARPFQNGLVQFYALLMALGVAGFVLATMLR